MIYLAYCSEEQVKFKFRDNIIIVCHSCRLLLSTAYVKEMIARTILRSFPTTVLSVHFIFDWPHSGIKVKELRRVCLSIWFSYYMYHPNSGINGTYSKHPGIQRVPHMVHDICNRYPVFRFVVNFLWVFSLFSLWSFHILLYQRLNFLNLRLALYKWRYKDALHTSVADPDLEQDGGWGVVRAFFQNTHNSVKYEVIWKCQITLPNMNY